MKTFFTISATLIGTIAWVPYLKDLLSRKTQPHVYSWLVWAITLGTGAFGTWYGGGGWGALNIMVGFLFAVGIFLFSLKHGTKNVTRSDSIVLMAALLAIVVSWRLRQPLLLVVMASAIDFLGYLPSYRKSFDDPWSETLSSWAAFAVSNVCSLLALLEYNWLTTVYLGTLAVANTLQFLICLLRRPLVPKPVME
jgi:hypothetical protein